MDSKAETTGSANEAFTWDSDDTVNIPSCSSTGSPTDSLEDCNLPPPTPRPTWGRSIEFLMSCISMSVGLGNIWRFPFTAYENGGGAFLIPYLIVLLLIGRPMYYMEMIIGQFTSRSSIKSWRMVPLFTGVGLGQIFAVCTVISYYCALLAIALHYLFASFSKELPWAHCKPEWGGNCVDSRPAIQFTNYTSHTEDGQTSSAELYFMNEVIKAKDDISGGIGLPDWHLTLWELLTWIVIASVIVRGIRGTGKASYFLAVTPYIVLFIILIRAVTLPGAKEGILFFIRPQFDKLMSGKVWYSAAAQMFFSLNCGMSAIVMFSSYNRFDHNIYRDALVVTLMDTFTSILGGITTFAVLGNLAHNLGITDISKVVAGGVGLAFVSYPDALAKIEFIPQLFSSLFFAMLFILGVGSLLALVNAVATTIWDQFPKLKYWQIVIPISIAGFLCGLLYITPGGQWLLNLVDYFGGTFIIFVLAIAELVGVFWIYGLENFCNDIEFMLDRRPGCYWKICWGFVTPLLMIIIFLYSLITMEPVTYNTMEYPEGFLIAGWALFGMGVILVPLWAVYLIGIKSHGQTLTQSLQPTESFGPADPEMHLKWIRFRKIRAAERKLQMTNQNWSEFKYMIMFFFNKHT